MLTSNPIILEEHERLGVPRNRMVIREERVVEKQTEANLDALENEVTFLVIGQLREQKHVPLTIEAFKMAKIPQTRLKLIGRAREEHELEIMNAVNNDERIERLNAYLEYDDFYRSFSSSHFVLFADEKGPSCITNGTMMEALIHHRPVICPDYNPYSYYVNQYGIGLLYKAGDVVSYATTLEKAADLEVEFFQKNIDAFLDTIAFDKVAKQFANDITEQIKKN